VRACRVGIGFFPKLAGALGCGRLGRFLGFSRGALRGFALGTLTRERRMIERHGAALFGGWHETMLLSLEKQRPNANSPAGLDTAPGRAGGPGVITFGVGLAPSVENFVAGFVGKFGLDRHRQARPFFARQARGDVRQGAPDRFG